MTANSRSLFYKIEIHAGKFQCVSIFHYQKLFISQDNYNTRKMLEH